MSQRKKRNEKPKLVGSVIQDRYRVMRLIGAGGMGEVYEVEHVRIGRRLALKRLLSKYTRDEHIVQRFHREARAATMIGHKHIVDVTDMGELEDGSPYLVLEYLEGEDLGALLRREGVLTIARTVHIMSQICDGLAAAHRLSIIHRDLKPENIFLLSNAEQPDFVKIVDFGISKVREGLDKARSLTTTGQALGTPVYMSIEQAHGKKDIDARADVYALGILLYRMALGCLPYRSENYMSLMVEILTGTPTPPTELRRDLPVKLEEVILKAMARERAERFQTTVELAEALQPFAELDGAPEMTLSEEERASLLGAGVGEVTTATVPGRREGAAEPEDAEPGDEGTDQAAEPEGDKPPSKQEKKEKFVDTHPQALLARAGKAPLDPQDLLTTRPLSPDSTSDGGQPAPEDQAESEPEDQAEPDAQEQDAPLPDNETVAEKAKGQGEAEEPEKSAPSVEALKDAPEPSAMGGPHAPPSAPWVPLAGLAIVSLICALFIAKPAIFGLGGHGEAQPAEDSPPPAETTPVAGGQSQKGTGNERAEPIRLKILAYPPRAVIFIEGQRHPNPTDIAYERSERPLHLRIAAPGYPDMEDTTIPDRDRFLRYDLADQTSPSSAP
jgi:serine/threonine-protein kinase